MIEIWREKDGGATVEMETYSPGEAPGVFTEAMAGNKASCFGLNIPLPFNMDILKWANETRKTINGVKVPDGVKFYNIFGTGLDTPHSVCYGSEEFPVSDLKQLSSFPANYVFVDGDGTVPVESARADGLDAVARVGIPCEHRGILADRHVFRIVKHWLEVDHDPYYNPVSDFVILPMVTGVDDDEIGRLEVTSLIEEWEIVDEIDQS